MNEPQKTAGKTKSNGIGTLLTIGATALATYLAMKNKDKLVAGFKSFAQHTADGTLKWPPAAGMNGSSRTPAPAPAGH